VKRPERLAQTWAFEGMPEASSTQTLTFTEKGGRTTLVALTRFLEKAHADAHARNGMEEGMQQVYANLDELLASLP
jgi:uncharacterized protein YndB with AHSA1/START domain